MMKKKEDNYLAHNKNFKYKLEMSRNEQDFPKQNILQKAAFDFTNQFNA